ncbi:MAG: indole-3-glycerol phosphate synthase TrpC [Candidatus Omnitrophica bacterium]|nr:indole-3-glycerol phosphate synthase TrpC [Candidatus Omnitrophota bacterium]
MNILEEIIETKKEIIKKKKRKFPLEEFKKQIAFNEKKYSIYEKLKNNFGIIGEIKRGSPSAGIIDKNINFKKVAKIYEICGISGISVLTCEPYFYGSIDDLKIVKETVKLPVLMKDFIIDEYQIYEGKFFGADFILLITRILDNEKIKNFIKLCEELNLEILIEVHNYADLKRIFELVENWENKMLGINNRDLDTLEVNIKNTINLIKFIEIDKIIVISESGIKKKEDVEILKNCGVRGILIGEGFLKSKNLKEKIEELKN